MNRVEGRQSAAVHSTDAGLGPVARLGAEKGGGPAMSKRMASCEVVTP